MCSAEMFQCRACLLSGGPWVASLLYKAVPCKADGMALKDKSTSQLQPNPPFFPKASPMLGFSFSCTHRGGARLSVRRRCVGRKEGGRKEGTEGTEGKEGNEGKEGKIAWGNFAGTERRKGRKGRKGRKPWK